MKIIKTSVLWLILLLFSTVALGQGRWSAEFRPGLNFLTEDLRDTDLEIGHGFEVVIAYRFMPHLSGYVGWGWNDFKTEASFFEEDDASFEETGYTFGFQFIHAIGESSLSYLIRAGAIYNRIKIEDNVENIIWDTDYGFGWQIGAGLVIMLDDRWGLRPELRYRSLSVDTEIGTTSTIDLNYIAIGVGVSIKF